MVDDIRFEKASCHTFKLLNVYGILDELDDPLEFFTLVPFAPSVVCDAQKRAKAPDGQRPHFSYLGVNDAVLRVKNYWF